MIAFLELFSVAMLEGTLVKSQRQMDLSIEYLPPLMSESHDQENQPIMSEQDVKDQSTPVAHQPNKTEQINEELKTMKECQEDVGREPLKIVVTSSGDGGSEPIETVVTSSGDGGSEPMETVVTSSGDGGSEPMETVVTSSGDGGSEPMETVVTSSDAGSPDHKAEEKAEAEEKRQVLQ